MGFGLATLEQARKQIEKSDIIQDRCKKNKEAFSSLGNQPSDEKAMYSSIKDSKLILLGEEHHNPSQRDYGIILKTIKQKKPELGCLFLEFNANDPEVKKLISGEATDSFNQRQYLELVTTARELGIKVFAVDIRDKDSKIDPKNIGDYILRSNTGIFENIKNLFGSNTCGSGLMVVGKAHIEHSQIQIDPKNSLKTFFKNSQVPTVAINLVYAGKNVYADNYDQQWKWNICNEAPPQPLSRQAAIGRNRLDIQGALVVLPIITYDYFLFLPEVEEKRLYP